MTLERIRTIHLPLARMIDKSKFFELAVGSCFLYICTTMVLWFLQLESPTSNQEMVMIQSIGFIAGALAVLRKSNAKLPTINVNKIKRIIKGK